MKGRFDEKAGKFVFGYAKHLRDALKNATFIGFTGTPIALEDKDTRAVFGDYVSIYDIQDAVDDGATVPIFYESRLAKLDVNQAEIDALNERVDEVVEDEEDIASREKTKSEWAALVKLVGAAPRLAQVAKDLVEHFETRTAVLEGKAMIVAMSRDICAHLYYAIVTLRPDWHDEDPEKLLRLPAEVLPTPASERGQFDAALQDALKRLENQHIREVNQRNLGYFDAEVHKLDAWADDLKAGLENEVKEVDREIKEVRRTATVSATLEEKLHWQKRQRELEDKRNQLRRKIFDRQDEIDGQRNSLIEDLEAKLSRKVVATKVFIIQWCLD